MAARFSGRSPAQRRGTIRHEVTGVEHPGANAADTTGTESREAVERQGSREEEPRAPWLRFTTIVFVVMLALIWLQIPFGRPFLYELYGYVLKAFEILNGNWTPMPDHPIGWPALLALAMWIGGARTVFQGMVIAHVVSAVLMALCVFPLAAIANRVMPPRGARYALVMFATAAPMLWLGAGAQGALSEPLYLTVILWCVYFMTGSKVTMRNVPAAVALAALAFYVRASGVVVILAVLWWLASRMRRKEAHWSALVAAIALFGVLSLGNLIPRTIAYGAPMNYGSSSRLLMVGHRPGAAYNIPSPSIGTYLATTPPTRMLDALVRRGLREELRTLEGILGPALFLLCLLGVFHYYFYDRSPGLGAVFLTLIVLLGGMAPAWAVYHLPRYLLPLFPFLALFAGGFLARLVDALDPRRILAAVVLLILVWASAGSVWYTRQTGVFGGTRPAVRDAWAHWIADNIRGRLVFDCDYELVHMCLPQADQHLDIGVSMIYPRTPTVPDFRLTPGPIQPLKLAEYKDIDEAFDSLRKLGVQYIMLCPEDFEIWTYLRAIDDPKWARHFVLLKHFTSAPKDHWEVADMKIYRIDY
jgi:hypothetical protein